ncbi:DsbA family protein [Cognatishimia sp. SS12]|uniref:DsbA family protein n=1 Tax=Cognatishimia sp. SS12 TaxID=2979465 RepID=UPI00232BA534|nr:DsbA family protein [Cognatishimia sp. SS12]MDC0739330.1 DsbA family protein [Cognatishimia sp. SS12]
MPNTKFIVIYDTYCGWCYGAHPVLDALVNSGAEVETYHRYLFQGYNAHRMADGFGVQAARMDARIGQMSGQEFSEAYMTNILGSKTEVLESGLTAQAAALAHGKGPKVELAVAARLQKLRYVDGVSATDRDAIVAALIAEGFSEADAARIGTKELAAEAAALAETAADYLAQVHAGGVPTILKLTEEGAQVISPTDFMSNPAAIVKLAA